jgi:hypothetical protein
MMVAPSKWNLETVLWCGCDRNSRHPTSMRINHDHLNNIREGMSSNVEAFPTVDKDCRKVTRIFFRQSVDSEVFRIVGIFHMNLYSKRMA